MKELYERLEVLQTGDAITSHAQRICHKTIQAYVSNLDTSIYQMLITHLAMAVTRVERNEPLNSPPATIMDEIYRSPKLEEAQNRVKWIEKECGFTIPNEEKDFLYMHFVSVLTAEEEEER
ncbi:PRD domain-containing protein [Metabacillus indicus]|uniref:PRD domain-containing protein n=1 Tax=Metabacillus indicus TaxID=246786 RepID=UPI002A008EB5|nr:PRD domain-containing protein [Metabacillus indicus]MDX8291458.1 PRD domain-containing protein [Metabacillus indicus]